MRKALFTFFIFSLTLSLSAQQDDSIFIKRLSDEILTNSTAYENLRHLTKKIGARLAGSPAMVKAEHWGRDVMTTNGAEKVWLQECMVPNWKRGGKDKAV